MTEPATPEPDTTPPTEPAPEVSEEEGERYDGGEIPGTTESPEEDGEN